MGGSLMRAQKNEWIVRDLVSFSALRESKSMLTHNIHILQQTLGNKAGAGYRYNKAAWRCMPCRNERFVFWFALQTSVPHGLEARPHASASSLMTAASASGFTPDSQRERDTDRQCLQGSEKKKMLCTRTSLSSPAFRILEISPRTVCGVSIHHIRIISESDNTYVHKHIKKHNH